MSRLLACGLFLMLGGCNLLKKSDSAPEPSVLPSATAIPVALPSIIPALPASPSIAAAVAVAPAVPSPAAVVPAGAHSKGTPSGAAATATKSGTASATVASAAPAASAISAVPSIPSLALPTLSAQCQSGCQKSYQDCTTQSGAANPVEMVQKCGAALSSCFASCK